MFKLIFPLFLTLFMFSANQSDAQIIDSLPWFKLPSTTLDRLFVLEDMNLDATYIISKSSRKNVVGLSKTLQKQLGVTRIQKSMKSVKGSMILERDGTCYKITCAKGSCDCTLMWVDVNKDKKVQPKKELRCVCNKTREACTIRGKKISCN